MRMLDRVKTLADKKSCTTGQLALAWVHTQGPDVFPIPGTKRIKYLEVRATYFGRADALIDVRQGRGAHRAQANVMKGKLGQFLANSNKVV